MKKENILNTRTLLSHTTDLSETLSIPSLLLSAAFLLCAAAALTIGFYLDDHSSSVYIALMTSAVVLCLIGLYRLFTRSRQLIYTPTGSALRKGFCYYESDDLPRLQQILSSSDFSQLASLSPKQGGNVRLDYFMSADANFIALQLFQYVPYTYESVIPVVSFRGPDSKTLSAYLIRK